MRCLRMLLLGALCVITLRCTTNVGQAEVQKQVGGQDGAPKSTGGNQGSSAPPSTAGQTQRATQEGPGERYQRFLERNKNPVKQGQIPQIELIQRTAPSPLQILRIKSLILDLSRIDNLNVRASSTTTGGIFLPMNGQRGSISVQMMKHRLESPSAFKELVSIGPDAIPYLLESLEDQNPIKVTKIHRVAKAMWFDQELDGNPLNVLESGVVKIRRLDLSTSDSKGRSIQEYTVKVGDVCFVAIGQIVGRSYEAVRYQPTLCLVINSPTHAPEFAAKIRKIWKSESPREFLLQSLLRDYSSIGIHHPGDPLDAWSVGSYLQCNAALRLLYYYPDESAAMISERLKSMDVGEIKKGWTDRFVEREVKNEVYTRDFIQAVSWSGHPKIREAITELFLRTTDEDIRIAALPGVNDPDGKIIPERLRPLLKELP
jgi:hypothetical protein